MTNVTREELVGRAREMVPVLRARAGEAERARRMPGETQRDFLDAGFYKIYRPKRFGGYEMEVGALVDVAAEVARGCGSSAWILSNVAGHEKGNGMRDPRAQEEVHAAGPEALTCACFPGKDAKTETVDGGVVLDGTWNFASGVDQASWNDFNIFLPREGTYPEHFFALVPKSDYEVIDDWYVTGLAATGSRSCRVSKVFVPAHRMQASETCKGGPTVGSEYNPAPIYKAPIWALGGKMFVSPLMGLAQGALDLTLENLGARRSITGADLGGQPTVHLRVAEADAAIDTARAVVDRDCRSAMHYARRGERPPTEERVRWRRNDAFAARLCIDAVEKLYQLAGARRLGTDDPFQRVWRDAHAAAAQITLAWDLQALNAGRVAFGLPPNDPRI